MEDEKIITLPASRIKRKFVQCKDKVTDAGVVLKSKYYCLFHDGKWFQITEGTYQSAQAGEFGALKFAPNGETLTIGEKEIPVYVDDDDEQDIASLKHKVQYTELSNRLKELDV